MRNLALVSLVLGVWACGGSAGEPLDPVDNPSTDDPPPDVTVGGEIDLSSPRMPSRYWFKPDGHGGFAADGPLHDANFDDAGFLWLGGHYSNGTVCSSPFGVRTAAVTIGRTPLDNVVHSVGVGQSGDLLVSRQSFIEKFTNNFSGVQQSWVFPFRPTVPGDLVVRVDVAGQEFLGKFPNGLHFAPSGDFGTTYSNAVWIDGNGVETSIVSRFEDGKIVLRVPGSLVASSKFPAVLDPQIDRNEVPVDVPVHNSPTGALARVPSVASTGLDYLAVWHDNRNGPDSDIFGMIVSTSGATNTPAPGDGILISRGATAGPARGVQVRPVVAFVGGSYLVVWEDFTSAALTEPVLVAARVSTAGVVTAVASLPDAAGSRPRLAARGTEALLVFERGGAVRAARFNGTSFEASQEVTPAGSEPSVATDPTGNYLVTYTDAVATDLFGRLVAPTGSPSGAAFPISAGAGRQELSAASFAGGNFIVVFHNANQGRRLFGTRISPAGGVLDTHTEALGPVGGVQIGASATLSQGERPTLACGSTACTVAWTDRRDPLLTDLDLFAQRIAFDLTLVGGEIAASTELFVQRTPTIAFASASNRFLLLWEDLRNGDPPQITGTRIDGATGSVMDPPPGPRVTASLGVNAQSASSAARITNGPNWLVAWADSTGFSGLNIKGSLFSDALAPTPLSNNISNAPGTQIDPAVGAIAAQHLVVWSDQRSGTAHIFGSRVTPTGTVLDLTGIELSPAGTKQQLGPVIATNGTDRYLVVWQDRRNGNFDILGAILASNGTPIASDIAIATAAGDQVVPSAAYDPVAGEFVVVWQDARAGGGAREVFGARVSTAGTVLDTGGLPISAGGTFPRFHPQIAFGSDRFLVVWEDRRSGAHIFGQRVRISNGTLILDGAEIPITESAPGAQQRVSLAFLSTDEFAPAGTQNSVGAFAVVWDDNRTAATTGFDIFGTVVFEQTGNLGDEFPIAVSTDSERAPALGPAGPPQPNGSLRMLVTYQRQNSVLNAQRVVMRRVTFAAKSINCTTSSCNNNCNTGENCDVNCSQADNCTTVCSTSTCFINCTGATNCSTNCIDSSNCFTDCRGTDTCHVTCATVPQGDSPNFCEIDCSDPNTLNCTDINCTGNNPNTRAQCVLRCPPGAPATQCSFATCPGGGQPLACTTGGVPNGVFACHTTTIDSQGTPCLN